MPKQGCPPPLSLSRTHTSKPCSSQAWAPPTFTSSRQAQHNAVIKTLKQGSDLLTLFLKGT